ncbi:hypothetical protein KUTeg_020848 [Tegillarca granosa]|uniref:PCI domain-containing protein n=1 Tax=Tegillarca granosa TaxID=220873 RepID=A0ABQ9EBS5_TEGGR|nr:hypothetical protein KUTeg_020848 [Tegillarca granosa]
MNSTVMELNLTLQDLQYLTETISSPFFTNTGSQNMFGQQQSSSSFGQSFGQQNTGFGQTQQPSFGATVFGQQQGPTFSQSTTNVQTQNLGGFGQTNQGATFGQQGPLFGQTAQPAQGSLFGQTTQTGQQGSVFGQTTQLAQQGSLFGQTAQIGQQGSVFGQTTQPSQQGSLFGQTTQTGQQGSVFGQTTQSAQQGSLFGQTTQSGQGALFGQTAQSGQVATGFVQTQSSGQQSTGFGQPTQTGQQATGFGQLVYNKDLGLVSPVGFGQEKAGLFGQKSQENTSFEKEGSGSVFGQTAPFGQTQNSGFSSTTGFGAVGSTVTGFTGSSTSGSLFSGSSLSGPGGQTTKTTHTFGGTGGSSIVSGSSSGIFSDATKTMSSGFTNTTTATTDSVFGATKSTNSSLFGTAVTKTNFGGTQSTSDGSTSSFVISSHTSNLAKELHPPSTKLITHKENTVLSTSAFGEPETSTSSSRKSLFGRLGDKPGDEVKGRVLFGKVQATDKPAEIKKTSRHPSDESNADEPKSKRTAYRRLSSVSDDATRIALVCKNVPVKINNAFQLKKHFSKFGEVAKVFPNPNKQSANIHFKNHAAAAEAKRRGSFIGSGLPTMTIFWSSYSPRSAVSSRTHSEEEISSQTGTKRKSDDASKSKSIYKWERKELDDELAAMGGTKGVKSLLSSVAKNSAQKLQILTVRDRVIRQGLKSQKSKSMTSQAFYGTCPDMCPERERYDREEKRRLHVYEIIPGTDVGGQNPSVDHTRAVKEYSRASADQIADRGQDGSWGEWYDFLWDRTRGLRKDITQQQLCSKEAVQILEKCVRFHIFCAERLCEEDMHNFDAKINNENMTKCLQTLKEFYDDLEKKQNIFCENEAEMRSYMILMNLNEGDILRETQGLRREVRNTPYINFALQVYSNLNSNNYVRFFRLVKNGSFLHACIMHRYFTQVRSKALVSLLKSYRKGVQYPLEDLIRTLGFENAFQAGTFCQHYGLAVNEDCVILDRSSYIEPEASWTTFRAQQLIEAKRILSVGETINGASLQPWKSHGPSSSFDSNGRFIAQIDTNEIDQPVPSTSQQPTREPVSQKDVANISTEPVEPPLPVKQQIKYNNEMVKEIAKNLFWEVIDEQAKQIGREEMNEVNTTLDESNNICEQILSEAVHNEVMTLRKKQEHEQLVKQASVVLTTDIIVEVVNQEVLNLATVEVREAKAQLKKEQIERCSLEVSTELIDSVVSEFVESISDNVYQKDVVERLQELADIEKSIQLKIAGRYLQYWKKEYLARCKLKRSMLSFPATASRGTCSEQIQALIPWRKQEGIVNGGFYVNERAQINVESPVALLERWQATEKALTAHDLYRKICYKKAWHPLDIGSLVEKQLVQHNHQVQRLRAHKKETVYWKNILSLPPPGMVTDKHSCHTVTALNKWIKTKLSKGKAPNTLKGDLLSLYNTDIYDKSRHLDINLAVCVRAVEGILGTDDNEYLDEFLSLLGTTGIILVLPPVGTLNEAKRTWGEARERLDGIFTCKPACPPVPLAIICPLTVGHDDISDVVKDILNLDQYFDEEKLSNVCIQTFDYNTSLPQGVDVEDPKINNKLCDILQWLASEYPVFPDLQVKLIKDYIDDFLLDQYFTPVLYNLKRRKLHGYLHQDPNDLLTLYNDVIKHLADVISKQTLTCQSWPVAEFTGSDYHKELPHMYWNNEGNLDYNRQLVLSLQLPYFEYADVDSEEWTLACKDVWSYVEAIVRDDQGAAKVDLYSRVRTLLKKTREDFEDTCYLMEGENNCQPTYVNMPWTDIIAVCIDYRLISTNFTDPESNRSQDSDAKEIRVVFFEDDLKNFEPPADWKHNEKDKIILSTASLNSTVNRAVEKTKKKMKDLTELNISIQRPDISRPEISSVMSDIGSASELSDLDSTIQDPTIDLEPLTEHEVKLRKTSYKFNSALKLAKLESQNYEKYLEEMLNDCGGPTHEKDLPDFACIVSESALDTNDIYSTQDMSVSFRPGAGLTDVLYDLNNELIYNRRESNAFEKRLQSWMDN